MTSAHIIRADEGRVIDPLPGEAVQLKLDKTHTGGALDLWVVTNDPQSGPPLHIHPHADELFYILEGTLTMQQGEEVSEVSAGDVVYIPKGVPHTFANLSDKPARSINVFCPSGLADFLVEVSDTAATDPSNLNMKEIAARHDLQLIGPPLTAKNKPQPTQ